MEPYFFVEVQAPADRVSSVYTVLARRRCVLFEPEAYHLEAFNPGSMLPIIPNQSNLTS